MRFDAPRFCEYDLDNDGRMTFEEFKAFIRNERRLGREVAEPRAARPDGPPPVRDAEQLRAAYDTDLDGFLGRIEIDLMLLDYGRDQERIDSAVVIQRLDLDGNGKLGISELTRLVIFLAPLGQDAARPQRPGASTVNDLFGTPIDMGENNAPRIVGPVLPFRRLDVNDGLITSKTGAPRGSQLQPISLEGVLAPWTRRTDQRRRVPRLDDEALRDDPAPLPDRADPPAGGSDSYERLVPGPVLGVRHGVIPSAAQAHPRSTPAEVDGVELKIEARLAILANQLGLPRGGALRLPLDALQHLPEGVGRSAAVAHELDRGEARVREDGGLAPGPPALPTTWSQ